MLMCVCTKHLNLSFKLLPGLINFPRMLVIDGVKLTYFCVSNLLRSSFYWQPWLLHLRPQLYTKKIISLMGKASGSRVFKGSERVSCLV